jgi:hypothetical protein
MLELIFIIIIFILGLIFSLNYKTEDLLENFEINEKINNKCPNLLIKKDNGIYLYNTKSKEEPLKFKNLEDYKKFMKQMKLKNIECPLLFLQQTFDTQGERTYRILPSIEENNAGLPVNPVITIETKLYGSHDPGSFPGFDPLNQYIGTNTPLDAIYHTKEKISDNPIDTNWGGAEHTRKSIINGKYSKREVYKISPDAFPNL